MPKSFNTQAKGVIRALWAKELLSFLHGTLGKKLFYLGLPAGEALDVQEWLEYLDAVYAFQCRDYPRPSSDDQPRDQVLRLDDFLRGLERRKLLSTFEVFDGYIEEVVLRGYDNSPTPKNFFHTDAVNVYNLDYCNSLTSPLEFVDKNGDVKLGYKFDALKKLMEMQAVAATQPNTKFLLFLTVHRSYDDANTLSFINNPPDAETKQYFAPLTRLSKGAKSAYILKAFVFYNLTRFFITNNFLPEFLPVLHYYGNGDHPLLFFTIVGTHVDSGAGIPTPLQTTADYLAGRFLAIEGNTLTNNGELLAHNEIEWQNVNPLEFFKKSKTFQRYWHR